MIISDVLEVSKELNTQLVTGHRSLLRPVLTIEVMEVPEVENWVTQGVLVITSFYSVRKQPDEQYRIVKALIHKKAAGIIVKLGKFVSRLSDEIIAVAQQHDFPIIILPRDVPYISVLTPLQSMLHAEQISTSKSETTLAHFENKSYFTVEEALNDFATYLSCTMYLEDIEGRLLSCSQDVQKDGWRESRLLFSAPSYTGYKEKINEWVKQYEDHSFVMTEYLGHKWHVIVPLFRKGIPFMFLHFVYNNKLLSEEMDEQNSIIVKNKLYMILMGEIVEWQQERMSQDEELRRFSITGAGASNTSYVLLFFQRELNQFINETIDAFHFPTDYSCFFRKEVSQFMNRIPKVQRYLIFERNMNVYVLLHFTTQQSSSTLELRNLLTQYLTNSPIEDSYIAISSMFARLEEVEEKVGAVTKIMGIGKKMHEQERIFSYNKLGIYEFFIELSTQPQVQEYVNSILSPLSQADSNLRETLVVYLMENGNASRAAEKLFVSRRTITYRLQKIKELLGTDLDDPENRFVLQFCLKIKQLD
ncbi:PucR family transcriptional regulator [Bacillus horti]|uniref:PucR family transcriptional regulator n=1 Tax=Caldalkalibacillus horti TaxID=77523 RepID=A0ABT9W3U0_9BACI|nr:PucR family transcriptional regulator [Bacillus horti]MDQ0167917.1 hypothetical protein [Bacillus horti]